MERKCNNCGAPLSDDMTNCPYCEKNNQNPISKQNSSQQQAQTSNKQNDKKGVFIAACICFAISILFGIIYTINYISIILNISSSSSDLTGIFLLLYLILWGSPFVIPVIGLLIATITCCVFSRQSCIKAIKTTSKILLIISIILLSIVIISVLYPFFSLAV